MASWRYSLFVSFHGSDVRKAFIGHLIDQFHYNGISMFDDQGIERGQTIAPALTQAIKESRISIVVLTENYASSGWCLDELVEIFKCKQDIGQIVMTVFYGVDPSDVRKQTGEFGRAFSETCQGKTEEESRRWSQALKEVGNIPGEYSLNWDDESGMIEKIARDVSNKLNATISSDFEDLVGIEARLEKMQSLLQLDDEDMIVGICGPRGIGKTTIARALLSRLSSTFQCTWFMENMKGRYMSEEIYEYMWKLHLQKHYLSKILNQDGMSIEHLGAIQDRLCDHKMLVILDDVDDLQQLEALADITRWFGRGSRIIVTTEDQELLEQHGINNTYQVEFPTKEDALEILCIHAFKQSYPATGFKELAESVVDLCGNLPLGLYVVGSSLRGKKEQEWEEVIRRLETITDHRDITEVGRACRDLNKPRGKSKSRCSRGVYFLVVINLLLEIASAVSDQMSSIRKPHFARISLLLTILSLVLSIFDIKNKIQDHKAGFGWKRRPVPWFYYLSGGSNRIFASFTDTVLLFCVVGQLIVSTINCISIQRGQEGPIKVSVWPIVFAIGMVISKFMEKPAISKDRGSNKDVSV